MISNDLAMIFHITTCKQWNEFKEKESFSTETLTTEGFIHCSTLNQLIKVANNLYLGQRDLLLLCIKDEEIQAEVRYEGRGEKYPHIYGEVNKNAIAQVIKFPPKEDGSFELPDELACL